MNKQVSPKIRFQVLERDGFSCKYCGRKAPNVQLEIDHIIPRCKGGTTTLNNLISACFECNRGKGKHNIKENSKDLYKRKINDLVLKSKNYFYINWNNAYLGTIDNKTITLLAMFINNMIKGDNNEFYKTFLDLPDRIIVKSNAQFEELDNQFLLGGEFCDKVLDYIYKESEFQLSQMLENIIDGEQWTKDSAYSERLNYLLTQQWEGQFYIIKKYSLFPDAYINE